MKLFEKLETVPTYLRKDLQVQPSLVPITDDIVPVGVHDADGYEVQLRLVSRFWVSHEVSHEHTTAMEQQLRISKEIIIRHLYGDVLDQLLPIKRAIANRDTREAFKLVEALEKSILEG